MARRVHPNWKWNIALLFVVKDYASLGMKQKAITRDSARGTVLTASTAILAAFHHLCFLPIVLLAGQIGVNSYKLEKASHAGNITDIVSSI
jgi:hypothetical protein